MTEEFVYINKLHVGLYNYFKIVTDKDIISKETIETITYLLDIEDIYLTEESMRSDKKKLKIVVGRLIVHMRWYMKSDMLEIDLYTTLMPMR